MYKEKKTLRTVHENRTCPGKTELLLIRLIEFSTGLSHSSISCVKCTQFKLVMNNTLLCKSSSSGHKTFLVVDY